MRKFLIVSMLMPAAPALAQAPGPGWSGHEWMWLWGPWFMLMPLLLLGLIVVGIVILVRYLWAGPGQSKQETRRALDLLNERYARGEIDREEYLRRRNDISGA